MYIILCFKRLHSLLGCHHIFCYVNVRKYLDLKGALDYDQDKSQRTKKSSNGKNTNAQKG